MDTLHQHPDDIGELWFDAAASRLFALNDAEGLGADVLIGPDGRRNVDAKLLTPADEMEVLP